jgi:hypothetical protein
MPLEISNAPVASAATSDSPYERFIASLKRVRAPRTIELHQKRLSFLARELDPFQPSANAECAQILAHYGLAVDDPYSFTNTLLRMLDALEEKQRLLRP